MLLFKLISVANKRLWPDGLSHIRIESYIVEKSDFIV